MGKENGWTGEEGKGGEEWRRGTPSKARGMEERGDSCLLVLRGYGRPCLCVDYKTYKNIQKMI